MDDLETFRKLTGDLNHPMVIATTAAEEERSGCLVGFSTPCSINPPRYLVLISDKNHTYRVAQRSRILAVHLLAEGDLGLAELFGEATGDEIDKFGRCRWSPGPEGVPLLDDCDSRFVGRILERASFGDHVAHVLDPVAAWRRSGVEPLRIQDVRQLEPGHDA